MLPPEQRISSQIDGFRINLALVFRNKKKSSERWAKRHGAWLSHANTFTGIKCDAHLKWNDTGAAKEEKEEIVLDNALEWGETRIKFLSDHLDILDRKFGVLLQFQALLGIVVTILLSFKQRENIKLVWFSGSFQWWLYLLGVIGIFWLVGTILCLTGIRRIVWGDMGEAVAKKDPHHTEPPFVTDAEERHVGGLVDEIIERTAKFRLAVGTTIWNIFFLVLLAFAIFMSLLVPDA